MLILASWLLHIALQQVEKQVQIDSIWPTSVAGWIGIVIAMLLLVDKINERIRKPADAAAMRVQETLSGDIKLLGDKLTSFAHEGEAQLENVQHEIEREGRECATRVSELATKLAENERHVQKLKEDMAQSREDRRHITQDIQSWKSLIAEWRKEDREREERERKDDKQFQERIFSMLVEWRRAP